MLVLASFSPTETFHLPMLLKAHRELDWSQQVVPSPLTPLSRSKAGGVFLNAVPAVMQAGKKTQQTNKKQLKSLLLTI